MTMGMAFFSTEGLIGSINAKTLVVVDIIYATSNTGSKDVPLFSNDGGYIIPLAPMRSPGDALLPVITFDDEEKRLTWAPPSSYDAGNFTSNFIIVLVSRPDA